MKNYKSKIKVAVIFFLTACMSSCLVDTLEDAKKNESFINLVQVADDGLTAVTVDNIIVDKENSLLRKTFGLAYSGIDPNEGFTADLVLDYNDVPEGYEKFTSDECFITIEQDEVNPNSKIEVPARVSWKSFYVNITKSAIESHMGENVAVSLKVTNVSNGNINIESTYVVIDMSSFSQNTSDVTDAYIKNAGFDRAPGTTERFCALAEWISNEALSSTRTEGAGYDANVETMGVEKWWGGDPSIVNGKIYQTFDMDRGSYQIVLEMNQVKGLSEEELNALVIAEGSEIPDDANIDSAIASQQIVNDDEYGDVMIEFDLDEDKQVSLGLLINVFAGPSRVLQANQIAIYRNTTLFD